MFIAYILFYIWFHNIISGTKCIQLSEHQHNNNNNNTKCKWKKNIHIEISCTKYLEQKLNNLTVDIRFVTVTICTSSWINSPAYTLTIEICGCRCFLRFWMRFTF